MNWNFKHRPDRKYKWETYYSPQGHEMGELYIWCHKTYGPTGERWDSHGGWIKFKEQSDVVLFLLRWS